MVELTADRLILVDEGTARDYSGSIEDYIDFVLGRNQPKPSPVAKAARPDRKASARARADERQAGKEVSQAEAEIAQLQAEVSGIDRAMFDPPSAAPHLRDLTMGELARRRAALLTQVEQVEKRWLAASQRLEMLSA
jgi:ATP-binding cassette subfamily F protein 3